MAWTSWRTRRRTWGGPRQGAARVRAARVARVAGLAIAACAALAACGDDGTRTVCGEITCPAPPAPRCDGDTQVATAPATCADDGAAALCSYAETRTDCAASGMRCRAGACVAGPDPCDGVACTTPPAARCDGAALTTYAAAGTCSAAAGAATCAYAPTTIDCGDAARCDAHAGACVDPCTPDPCTTPPADTCDGTAAVRYPATGACRVAGGAVACTYAPVVTDCAAADQACVAGACVDPCAQLACTTPPAPSCHDGELITYAATGTCTATGGVAACSYARTTTDCGEQHQRCDATAGACVDPCTPDPCTAPPPATCSGQVATRYPAVGACTATGDGVPACAYAPTTIDCGAQDLACAAGACVDPCASTVCAAPPPASCSGDTLTTYAALGTCAAPGGVAACSYAATATDCGAQGLTCAAGACAPAVVIALARLDAPTEITDAGGAARVVHGRVRAPGLTDRSDGDDLDPHLVAQVGFGDAVDPAAWTWLPAAPTAGYGASAPGFVAGEDDYSATITLPDRPGWAPHLGVRFSGDAGHTWVYGDLGAGSADGWNDPAPVTIVGAYISEYVDGSGQADALELYNPGETAFALDGCAVDVYANGSATVTATYPLGTSALPAIAPADVFVLCSNGYQLADKAACDERANPVMWTGNDAIVFRCGATTLDVIGQIGFDPGVEWGAGVTSTNLNTLLRKCDVTTGDRNGADPFVPSVQWQGYGTDVTFLGARNCPLP